MKKREGFRVKRVQPESEIDHPESSSKRNSKYAAIFYIALAALIGILVFALWLENQHSHFLDK
ncbi:MAG TPA: hypothetical protein VGL56_14295 [Fimbriimonadaceae bacterium]|jgi:hypothetical protein